MIPFSTGVSGEKNLRRAFGSILSAVLAGIIVVLPAMGPAAAQRAAAPEQRKSATQDPLDQFNAAVEQLVKKVRPSVVQVLVTSYGPREESERGNTDVVVGRQRSVASGFVIDPDGYIMTNAHVINGAQRIQVVLPAADADASLTSALSARARIVPARVVGFTNEIDLAVLKIDAKVPALPLATYTKVKQGELVFAFGSPSGLNNTITRGIVSAVARQTEPDSPLIYIQTDAAINPGNSGGPLVNVNGEVVGVNTFIMSRSGGNEGLGFAVPCATARTVFRQLKSYGQLRRQEIGVGLQTITPIMAAGLGLSRDYGVIVADVLPGSPAEASGLRSGDILVSVDGHPADNLPSVNYFFRLRDSTENVKLVVLRGGTQQNFNVQTVEVKSELDDVSNLADAEKNLVAPLGILGIEIDQRIASMAKGLRSPYGVIVAARAAGATTEIPLAVGDIVRDLNGKPMTSLDFLRTTLRNLPRGAPVTLQVQREGRLLYVAFTLD